jgi:membrane peptidoglycan carboxypeptidase
VTDASGRSIDVPRSQCDQAVPAGLADTITSILHGVLTKPGATAVGVGEPDHRPAAAKTGTAENNSASNFAGYTPQMAAAVWVGDPRNPNRSLNGTTIGGTYYREVFGASIAGPIWRDTLAAALQGKPVLPLPPPDPEYLRGVTTPLPYVIGLSVADAERELTKAGFHPVVGSTVSSALPAGTVAATSPSGAAPPGGTVVLEISNGQPPAPPPTRSASPQPSASPKASKSASPAPSPAPKPKPTCSKPGHGKHC